ncbi:Ribosomal RNA small subunit methyltransferase I [bioreactor metagenome]|uniref:Ribosomal RNA small subunit methyltransferase I n=1 Tax=bioreactor metagenome TaxID=1076179 RepID=A0A645GFX4_9ZZZZ
MTDAGLPAISDPGEDIVRLCIERNIVVCPIPGPCAAVTALCASGLPAGRFAFEGFLSTAKKSRAEHLSQLKEERRTMVFYEAPHKLLSTLRDLQGALGERNIVLARELTKIYEEFIRLTLSEAIERFSGAPARGEFVLMVEGKAQEEAKEMGEADVKQLLDGLIVRGLSKSEAAKEAAKLTTRKKSDLYKLLLEEKKDL